MALRLLVLTAQLEPPASVLMKGRRIVLGRGETCEVRLPDPTVSRQHATIVKRGENYLLIDQGSRHGTHVSRGDGPLVQLAPDSPRILEDGEHIWLGDIELEVRFEAAKRGAPTGFEDLAPTLVRAGLAAVGVHATDERVADVLRELTELDEESPAAPDEDWHESTEDYGVAALREDDEHPPWVADVFVAAVAALLATGCILALMHLEATF